MSQSKRKIIIAFLACLVIALLLTKNKADLAVKLPEPPVVSSSVPQEQLGSQKLNALIDRVSKGEMPTTAEISELYGVVSQEEYLTVLRSVGELISNTPKEVIYKRMEENIKSTLDAQDHLVYDHFTVEYSHDDLSMLVPKNQKLFNNVTINLNVYYDTGQFKDIMDEKAATQELSEQMRSALVDDPYTKYKLNYIELQFCSTKNLKRFQYSMDEGSGGGAGVMTIKQSKDELHLQTLAYDFVLELSANPIYHSSLRRPGHKHDVVLTQFGIIEDSKELFAEILIYDIKSHDDSREKVVSDFKDVGASLADTILEDTEALNYLKATNVSKITVSFDIPWYQYEREVFHYDIP